MTQQEKEEYCALFKEVFGLDFSLEDFEKKYDSPAFGYSYHGLMIYEGHILGSNSIIPFHYDFFGKKHVFGLDLDTMISKKVRGKDVLAMKKLWKSAVPVMLEDNIPFVFGFPNAIAYPYWQKVIKWTDIGNIHYYVHPIRVGKLAGKFNFLNPFSRTFCALTNGAAALFRGSKKEINYNIDRVMDEKYESYRYKDYKTISTGGEAVTHYSIVDEEQGRVAYIIDAKPFSPYNLRQSVRAIARAEKGNIDAILHIDRLGFFPINLFKAPTKFEPIKIRMAGEILNKEVIDERVLDVNNWHICLGSFDVR